MKAYEIRYKVTTVQEKTCHVYANNMGEALSVVYDNKEMHAENVGLPVETNRSVISASKLDVRPWRDGFIDHAAHAAITMGTK